MRLSKYFILTVFFIIIAAGVVLFLLFRKSPPAGKSPTVSPMPSSTSIGSLDERLKICESIPNGTTQEINETSRLFINLPEDIYPFKNRQFAFNGATAGIISSGEGLPPKSGSVEEFIKNKCATHYYDFEGNGTVNLKVKSAVNGVPDYEIHFMVKGESK